MLPIVLIFQVVLWPNCWTLTCCLNFQTSDRLCWNGMNANGENHQALRSTRKKKNLTVHSVTPFWVCLFFFPVKDKLPHGKSAGNKFSLLCRETRKNTNKYLGKNSSTVFSHIFVKNKNWEVKISLEILNYYMLHVSLSNGIYLWHLSSFLTAEKDIMLQLWVLPQSKERIMNRFFKTQLIEQKRTQRRRYVRFFPNRREKNHKYPNIAHNIFKLWGGKIKNWPRLNCLSCKLPYWSEPMGNTWW